MKRWLLPALTIGCCWAGKLTVYPSETTLFGPGAVQRFAVTLEEDNGVVRDVSTQARITATSTGVAEMLPNAQVRALAPGRTEVRVMFGGQTASARIQVEPPAGKYEVSFVKDIVPILTRGGCAGSNCHGSIRGKGGFKLSLFGYEPKDDYEALVKADNGKRVDLANPEQSLVLKKPTFQVPHGGGIRFKPDSLEYTAIRDWLRAGAKFDSAGSPRIASLTVYPAERRLVGLGAEQRLIVTAAYSDGAREDVTAKVQFTSNNDGIATVNPGGVVKAETPGETAVMIRTLGHAIVSRITVVKDPPMANYPRRARANFVDELVFDKLQSANIIPSEPAGDAEFLRRVYLDVTGVPPPFEQAAAFLDSTDPGKRAKLIDMLLDSSERSEFWAQYFADLFRLGFNESRDKGAKLFYNWLRDNVQEDRPYGEMVRELMAGQGNVFYDATANFYFITRKMDPGDIATHVSQTLLGVRIECAKCHNHPWEKWTQDDFYGLAAFFPRLATKFVNAGSESNVYLRDAGTVIHPKTKTRSEPRYLGGDIEREGPGEDIRVKLGAWITSPSNPYFARAIVNRIWKRYLGRGLVEPVDDFRITNPASNEKLLDRLAAGFIRGGFRLRAVERLILNSATYQLSSHPNETNRTDTMNHSRYYPKRMQAEQLLDSIVRVTGVPERFAGWVPARRAMALPHGSPTDLLTIFGRVADREFIRERDTDPNLTQTLHLMNAESMQKRLASPEGNLAHWLVELNGRDAELVDRLYLAALSRRARPDEWQAVRPQMEAARTSVAEDLAWALLNSKEFLYIH
jgi:hypothetical protein